MNLYHCMIELKSDAKALAFSTAAHDWLDPLLERGLIGSWRLFRRKFGLGSGRHSDFILEIELENMAELERTFFELGQIEDEEDEQRYARFHALIATADIGLYRPYPDATQRERIALI